MVAATIEEEHAVTDLGTKPEVADPTTDGDHERMAHIVDERFGTVAEAIVNGTPCVALCGKVWVPNRDPRRYPLCPTCKEIAQARGWQPPAR
ncbi:MAG: DUF3039 domain-containing protein [Actinomycetota bacterium]|nr:DUF3039 domain-containing protein [Actinomycetota bacterium]